VTVTFSFGDDLALVGEKPLGFGNVPPSLFQMFRYQRSVQHAWTTLYGTALPSMMVSKIGRRSASCGGALDRPVDVPMSHEFLHREKGWSVDQLLQTKLTEDEAPVSGFSGGDRARLKTSLWPRVSR
jgi:hypothetical protein